MIKGFKQFQEWFEGYDDAYVIIGGVACELLLESEGIPFRATKDLDMVLLIEAITPEFVNRFWEYIEAGEYEHINKSTDDFQFYRFSKPKDDNWISMIELFSRKPDDVLLSGEPHLTPIPTDEDISSLSAILLDDDYYNFLLDGRVLLEGIPVLEPTRLIPFKMKAYLDFVARKEMGEHVDSKNIKKHKNDVFRLLLLLSEDNAVMNLPITIQNDIQQFIEKMDNEDLDVKALGLGKLTKDDLIERLKGLYINP